MIRARLLSCFRLSFLCWAVLGLLQGQTTVLYAQTPRPPLQVFAAASLKNALDEIGRDWTAEGHAPLTITYAASSTLAQQIAAGAPADVFFSADLDWMDWLSARGKIRAGQSRILAGNQLVLIAKAQNPVTVTLAQGHPLASALAGGRLAIADPRAVPAGKYGKAALEFLGLWDQVAPALAPAEHVRAVLNFVARGEAPLGIVYRTDLKAEAAVRLVASFPEKSHPPILYPAGVTAQSVHPEAEAFLASLAGPPAQARLAAEGFLSPPVEGGKP